MSHPRSYQTGKKAKQMDAEYRAWMDAKPCVASCLYCDWRFAGTVAECREQSAEHRESHGIKRRRRPRAPMTRFNPGLEEHREEGQAKAAKIAAMHARKEVA